jgi:hypothetical protein
MDILLKWVFILWFVLSVVWQFTFKALERYRRMDMFRLLPVWTFFAPNPGTSDLHLLFRIGGSRNGIQGWQELPHIDRERFYRLIWNPERRKMKALKDCLRIMGSMTRDFARGREDIYSEEFSTELSKRLCFSVPYLIILNTVVRKVNCLQEDVKIQFAIAESYGFYAESSPRPIIRSLWHQVNKQ